MTGGMRRSTRSTRRADGWHNAQTVQLEGREEAREVVVGEALPSSAITARVDVSASSLRFVYPFTFDGGRMDELARGVEAASVPGGERSLAVWERSEFPTDDLLAQVADFVAPASGAPLTAALWRMPEATLRSHRGVGGGSRHPGAVWTLRTRRGAVDFTFDSFELALFRHGVGFVVVGATPASDAAAVWFTFLHFFRYISGRRASPLTAVRQSGEPRSRSRSAFFPDLGGICTVATAEHHTGEIVDALLAGAVPGSGRWWEEIFVPGMMLPYAAAFIDGVAPAGSAALLHRLRNFFHGDQVIHPAGVDIAGPDPGLLPYAEQQWFVHSLNGGGFLACDAPATPFFRSTLPGHIRNQYFLLFLLALEQRFFLMALSQQVSRRWVGRTESAEKQQVSVFTGIRDALLSFTAQGFFAQTMQEEHHHRSYERWREIFALNELYREVSAEVREMHGQLELRERQRSVEAAHVQQRQSAALDRRLAFITWLLGLPVSLLLVVNASGNIALVRHILFGPVGVQPYDVFIGLGLEAIGIAVGLLAYTVLQRRTEQRAGSRDEGKWQ
ncbi:MAG: hypothetical protein JOY68_05025 [Candidatus Dormibacteraeota bacterium]|nr:hypothetical protein [Candidatus Dormibacteraeota bacterium]